LYKINHINVHVAKIHTNHSIYYYVKNILHVGHLEIKGKQNNYKFLQT